MRTQYQVFETILFANLTKDTVQMRPLDLTFCYFAALLRLTVGSSGGAEPVEQPAAWGAESRHVAALSGLPEHQILWPAHSGATSPPLFRQRLRP